MPKPDETRELCPSERFQAAQARAIAAMCTADVAIDTVTGRNIDVATYLSRYRGMSADDGARMLRIMANAYDREMRVEWECQFKPLALSSKKRTLWRRVLDDGWPPVRGTPAFFGAVHVLAALLALLP